MRAFFSGGRDRNEEQSSQHQRQSGYNNNVNDDDNNQNNNSSARENPVMDFLRQSFGGGQSPADLAAAAAAQIGGLFNENFHVPFGVIPQMPTPHGPTGPPPASQAALRQLPTISVTAEDLVDPCNRECCICFEE